MKNFSAAIIRPAHSGSLRRAIFAVDARWTRMVRASRSPDSSISAICQLIPPLMSLRSHSREWNDATAGRSRSACRSDKVGTADHS